MTATASTSARIASLPDAPIEGPSAWYGSELVDRPEEWIYRLSPAEVAEIDAALGRVVERGLDILDITREDFPLPTLGAKLDGLRRDVLCGRGFVLIRGLPVGRYTVAQSAAAYWGIGRYFGKPLSQNGKGHVLGHVKDLGREENDPSARIYQTTARQYYHTDSCDIVGLLCLKKAKEGGLSSIVSSVTVFNEMLKRRPDLAAVLTQPLAVDRRGEVPEGRKPWFALSTFNWHEGLLSTYYVRRYIESARRFDDVRPLTAEQVEALDFFDSLANDPKLHLDMAFEPGDIQLLHNHQILHDRTAFVDWPEPENKRHLLRLWLCPPDGRPLPDIYADRYNGTKVGDRGGIMTRGYAPKAPLEAE